MNIYASIKASELGCVLDCDLQTGLTPEGGSPTDNTARINAYLAGASSTNPLRLILDGATATTGIIGPAGGYWAIEGIGDGSGIFILSGSNSMAIRNHPNTSDFWVLPLGAPPTPAGPVMLRNFYINGNRGNGTTGNSNSGYPNGTPGQFFVTGIDLASSQNSVIENVTLYQVGAYSIRLLNTSNTQIRGVKIFQPTVSGVSLINTDGIHLSGNNTNCFISDGVFQAGDDTIALNQPEGYTGAIDGVFISDCQVISGPDLVRTYGNMTNAVINVFVSRITGYPGDEAAFFLGGGTTTTDVLNQWKISDCTWQNQPNVTTQGVYITDSFGEVDLTNLTWYSPLAGDANYVLIGSAVTISSLTLRGCKVYQSSIGNQSTLAGISSDESGAVIGKLLIDGLSVDSQTTITPDTMAYLIDLTNLSITELYIESLDPTNITALVNPAYGFGNVVISGPGVLASGYQIPDANMANNCPYISATSPNTGNPCIKIGGTVYAFTISS